MNKLPEIKEHSPLIIVRQLSFEQITTERVTRAVEDMLRDVEEQNKNSLRKSRVCVLS